MGVIVSPRSSGTLTIEGTLENSYNYGVNTVIIEQVDKFRLYDVNNGDSIYSGNYAFLDYYAKVDNSNAFSIIDTLENLYSEKEEKVPVGTVLDWHKTFAEKSSGTNDSTSANRLADSTASFITNGVQVGMTVHNETDETFANVVAVNSENNLTLDDNIFTSSGKAYKVYATRKLSELYLECNGQIVNDPESIYHGAQLPDLNNPKNPWNSAGSFIRGGNVSGVMEDDEFQSHWHEVRHAVRDETYVDFSGSDNGYGGSGPQNNRDRLIAKEAVSDGVNEPPRVGAETKPVSTTMVKIIRIK